MDAVSKSGTRSMLSSPNKLIAHCKLQFVEIYWTDETDTTLCRKLQGTLNITTYKVQKKSFVKVSKSQM